MKQERQQESGPFTELWETFQQEAGFGSGTADQEKQKLRDEIALLEKRIEEKRAAIDAVDHRDTAARDMMKAMLSAGMGSEAVLAAMRVQYKVKRAAAPRTRQAVTTTDVSEEDKKLVLEHLDQEGLTMGALSKATGRDSNQLRAAVAALLQEGKATKLGEGKASRYCLA